VWATSEVDRPGANVVGRALKETHWRWTTVGRGATVLEEVAGAGDALIAPAAVAVAALAGPVSTAAVAAAPPSSAISHRPGRCVRLCSAPKFSAGCDALIVFSYLLMKVVRAGYLGLETGPQAGRPFMWGSGAEAHCDLVVW
jgi:hypothetical protein